MGTKLFLIVTANRVYGTYHKTICFSKSFTNYDERMQAELEAKAALFSVALTFGSVFCDDVKLTVDETDEWLANQQVFKFLEQSIK